MFHSGRVADVRIANFMLQETGTYNPMYNRPYQTYVDGQTMSIIADRVARSNGNEITATTMTGLASQIVRPSAAPVSAINIPYGWSERRIRFILEVHVTFKTGTTSIYYFQGYTSHLGVTQNGAIDPNMIFCINSFMRVNRANQLTPMGVVTQDYVQETAHVINGVVNYSTQNNMAYSMRPMDVIAGAQTAYTSQYGEMQGTKITDTRTTLTNEAIRSNRQNSLPSAYVANIVNRFNVACNNSNFGNGTDDILSRAIDYQVEDPLISNPFLFAISNVKGIPNSVTFNFNDLSQIDPNTPNVTKFVSLGNTKVAALHSAGQTAYWDSISNDTTIATILSNAVPAVMMELFITKIHFRSTNHAVGGQMNTIIIDAKSMTNADLTSNFEMFKIRLQNELMFDITYSNQELYTLDMSVDLFGETIITLSYGNNPPVTFATPSFCDSLIVPVVTTDKTIFNNNVHDFEVIMNAVTETRSSPSFAVINQSI